MEVLKKLSLVYLLFAVGVEAFHVQVGTVCQNKRRGKRMVKSIPELLPALQEMCAFTKAHCDDLTNRPTAETQNKGDLASLGVREYILVKKASKLADALRVFCQTGGRVCEPTVSRTRRLVAISWRQKKQRRRIQLLGIKTSN